MMDATVILRVALSCLTVTWFYLSISYTKTETNLNIRFKNAYILLGLLCLVLLIALT
jgi:hypothetical protein